MTDQEAEKIQNTINELQAMLDDHFEEKNRIRPQEKGLKSYKPDCNISWDIEHGLLKHIECTNIGNVPLSINVYQAHYGFNIDVNNREPFYMDVHGTCMGVIYVGIGNTEHAYIGYPCNDLHKVYIEIKDANSNEILAISRVE